MESIKTLSPTAWFCARTKPNAEFKAEKHLREQGFDDVYIPCFQKRVSHARRSEVVSRPLFGRYIFVSLDPGVQQWRLINSTPYVDHLICNGDYPAIVGDDIIKSLRDREIDGFIKLDCHPRCGDKVRITDGTFTNFTGLLEGTDEQRVTVLLEILSRKVRVELSAELIAAA